MQKDQDFTTEDYIALNPSNAISIRNALKRITNPARACRHIHGLVQMLLELIKKKREDKRTQGYKFTISSEFEVTLNITWLRKEIHDIMCYNKAD